MLTLLDAIRSDIRVSLDSGLFEPPTNSTAEADLIKARILGFAHALHAGEVPEEPLEIDEVKLDPADPLGVWARFAGHLLNGAWEARQMQSLDLDQPSPSSER